MHKADGLASPWVIRLTRRARLAALLWILALVFSVSGPAPVPAGAPSGVERATRRETRPTLDPALFVGKAAAAHRVAREMPGR